MGAGSCEESAGTGSGAAAFASRSEVDVAQAAPTPEAAPIRPVGPVIMAEMAPINVGALQVPQLMISGI